MLTRVTLGQTRFVTPGVAPDARGVVIGRLAVLLFASLDGAVTWLRLYAGEDSLDDLLPSARLQRLIGPGGGPATALVIPAPSASTLDRAARCARLAGGAAFTGSARHFVKCRDEKAPYGYDAIDLGPPGSGANGELVLHDHDGARVYQRRDDSDAGGLIMRLSLRRVAGSERPPDVIEGTTVYFTVEPGLARGVVGYLLRNRVRAEVAEIAVAARSAFGRQDGFLLVRVHDLPARLYGTLGGVPGLTLYGPVIENVAVELGWSHPIALTSTASLFPRESFYLFGGTADRVDVATAPAAFSPIEHFAPLKVASAPRVRRAVPAPTPMPGARLEIELRLVPTLAQARRVIATLIDHAELERLKKLVYALPPVMLRAHQIALTDRGALIIAENGVDIIPLGTLLCEVAPGLLVPLGMDLVPRVPTDVLAAAIERRLPPRTSAEGGGRIIVFPPTGAPFFVATAALAPLERRVVAQIDVGAAEPVARPPVIPPGPAHIVNDPVGSFALWGFPRPPTAR